MEVNVKALNFWNSHEANPHPDHFARIQSMHTGKPEKVEHTDGTIGLSSNMPVEDSDLKDHAKKVQQNIQNDKNIEKKYIDGKPYIKLYRGVKGSYGKEITKRSGMDYENNSVENRHLNIPISSFASWTSDPDVAKDIALSESPRSKDHGVVMASWVPLDSVLHSGSHSGVPEAHSRESEIIVGHPNGKVRVKTKDMQFQRAIGGKPGDEDFSHTKEIIKPNQIRPKPFTFRKSLYEVINTNEHIFDSLEKTESRKLYHLSRVPGLTRLDPQFYGTGHKGKDYYRAPDPRTYYYFEGTQPEKVVAQQSPYRYTAEIPEGHKIYDIGRDPEGVISQAAERFKTRQVNPGIVTPEEKEQAVKDAGYHGYYDSTHPIIPNAVAYFHPLDVQQVDSPLIKVGDGYKKLMQSGVALLHPVSINGKEMSNDGIPFHTTIKVFHPENDTFSNAHRVATGLDLIPPDPRFTTVKPMIFKDRYGDDVHVLELGGDAERIVDHNQAFEGMGFPVKYKFRPHITLDEETYNRVLEQKPQTAADLGISFSNAELRHGYETVHKYPAGE